MGRIVAEAEAPAVPAKGLYGQTTESPRTIVRGLLSLWLVIDEHPNLLRQQERIRAPTAPD